MSSNVLFEEAQGCEVPVREELVKLDKKFLESVERKVKRAIKQYMLFSIKDKVLVAVSGGKDSTVLLHVLKKLGYNIEAVTVDVHIGCYTKENLKNIQDICVKAGIKLHVLSFRELYGFSVTYILGKLKAKGKPLGGCTVCGVLRRRLLNQMARKLKADVIALGHNADDEAENYLMNLFRNRQSLNARLGAKPGVIRSDNFVPRVKPLYYVTNAETKKYSQMMGFPCYYGQCPCSTDGYRRSIRDMLASYGKRSEFPIARNIVSYLEGELPLLRAKFAREDADMPNVCEVCGEPSKEEVCRSCDILQLVKEE